MLCAKLRASAYRLASVASVASAGIEPPGTRAVSAAFVAAIALALASLAACSFNTPNDPETAGGAGQASAAAAGSAGMPISGGGAGGSSSGSQSLGGNGAGGAPAGGAAPTPSGGAMACGDYADQSAWQLKIRIENQRTTTVYVGAEPANCPAPALFQVEDGARELLPGLGDCRASCSAMMAGSPTTCPSACATPSTVTLAPRQVIELPWDGRFGVPRTLPRSCVSASTPDPASCVQASHIVAGPYTFTAKAGTKHDCVAGSPCTCTPTADGNCTTPQSFIGGTVLTTEFFVLVEPGDTGPNGQAPIELVFKD